MNIEHLTKPMWEVIRTWEYETLVNAHEMFQPVESDEDEY